MDMRWCHVVVGDEPAVCVVGCAREIGMTHVAVGGAPVMDSTELWGRSVVSRATVGPQMPVSA